jgi:hypothetical protein
MQEKISTEIGKTDNNALIDLYKSIKSDNLEKTLNILYAKKHYLEGCVEIDASASEGRRLKITEKAKGIL